MSSPGPKTIPIYVDNSSPLVYTVFKDRTMAPLFDHLAKPIMSGEKRGLSGTLSISDTVHRSAASMVYWPSKEGKKEVYTERYKGGAVRLGGKDYVLTVDTRAGATCFIARPIHYAYTLEPYVKQGQYKDRDEVEVIASEYEDSRDDYSQLQPPDVGSDGEELNRSDSYSDSSSSSGDGSDHGSVNPDIDSDPLDSVKPVKSYSKKNNLTKNKNGKGTNGKSGHGNAGSAGTKRTDENTEDPAVVLGLSKRDPQENLWAGVNLEEELFALFRHNNREVEERELIDYFKDIARSNAIDIPEVDLENAVKRQLFVLLTPHIQQNEIQLSGGVYYLM